MYFVADFSADEPIYEAVLPRDGEVTSPVLPPPVAIIGNKQALRPKSPGVELLQRGTSPQGQRTPNRRSVSPNCASPRHSRPNSRASSSVSLRAFQFNNLFPSILHFLDFLSVKWENFGCCVILCSIIEWNRFGKCYKNLIFLLKIPNLVNTPLAFINFTYILTKINGASSAGVDI